MDEFGQFPKSVKILFEKKRLEILINSEEVDQFREVRGQNEIIFTKAFSSQLDGVKLFELLTTVSKDLVVKYINEKIQIQLPKTNDSLMMAIEVLVRTKEAQR